MQDGIIRVSTGRGGQSAPPCVPKKEGLGTGGLHGDVASLVASPLVKEQI